MTMTMTIQLHQPERWPAALPVPYDALHGTWHVLASTLPIWYTKCNVTFTFSPLASASSPPSSFDDRVEFNNLTDGKGAKKSVFKGTNWLVREGGAAWKWRGKGFLMIASSSWHLLGLASLSSPSSSTADPEWLVTLVRASLFAPAGLYIYARSSTSLSDAQVEELMDAVGKLGGEVESVLTGGDGWRRVVHD